MPLLLVLVGSKESQNPNQQARSSWSTGEMLLISKLPTIIKKGFIAAKCTFKHCVGNYRDGNMDCDGRSHVGSYHLKTTLLNHLEKVPPSKYYSSFHLMMNLFEDLRVYLERGNLPHHFLPECNLLSTIGSDERKIALDTIEHIVHDPKAIILKCPSNRVTIYGDIHPDDLVKTFGSVFGDPGCKQSWKDLSQILSRLDQHRQFLYRKQLESDKCLCRSPRPELTGLVDMLKKIKHDWYVLITVYWSFFTVERVYFNKSNPFFFRIDLVDGSAQDWGYPLLTYGRHNSLALSHPYQRFAQFNNISELHSFCT